uniref:Syntaxin N-terminal domain-containing protein n=1 Tax=Angiostrongylus cantonensis TaxID=6313 RepID=A0A0K0CVD2_ANGCA
MNCSFDSNGPTWSLNDKSLLSLRSYVDGENLENSIWSETSITFNSEPLTSVHDEPTYINICSGEQSYITQMSSHFGDRFKGLFLFLRETNAHKSTITSLQQNVEELVNVRSNYDLATGNNEQFDRNIAIFAKTIDNRLRQMRRISEEQFNIISNKLTKLEKKQRRGRSDFAKCLGMLRKQICRLLTGKNGLLS